MNAETPWIRIEEAAAYARCHPAVLYRACREHKLTHARLGGRRKIVTTIEYVDQWIASQLVLVKAS